MSAPEIVEQINQFKQSFGEVSDFTEIKKFYNDFLLNFETEIEADIEKSENPLKTAVKYAMSGNYIDFGVMESVDEQILKKTLQNADNISLDRKAFFEGRRWQNLFSTIVLY